MGMAGIIFEPLPPNFEDIQIMLVISLLVSDFQRSVLSVPSIYVAIIDLSDEQVMFANKYSTTRSFYSFY